MEKNNVITKENNTENKITKKKALALGKNVTIMLMTAAIMILVVPEVSADMNADQAFNKTVGFITKWFKRVGGLVAFVGIIMFGLAIKNNDADQKQNGLLTMVAGFVVVAACGLAGTFGLTATE